MKWKITRRIDTIDDHHLEEAWNTRNQHKLACFLEGQRAEDCITQYYEKELET